MNKIVNKLALILIALLSLTACMNKPHHNQIQTAIAQFINQETMTNTFMIKNIKKVQEVESHGIYYIDVSYEKHCLISKENLLKTLSSLPSTSKNLSPISIEGPSQLLDSNNRQKTHVLTSVQTDQYGNFRKGDIIFETVRLKFVNTEKGWYLSSHQSELQQPIITAEL